MIYSDSEESLMVAKNLKIFGTFDGKMGEDGGYFFPFFYSRIGFGIFIFFIDFFVQNLDFSAKIISFVSSSLIPIVSFFFLEKIFKNKFKSFISSVIISFSPLFTMWSGFSVSNSLAIIFFLLSIIYLDSKIFSLFLFLAGITRMEVLIFIPLFFLFFKKNFSSSNQKFLMNFFLGIFLIFLFLFSFYSKKFFLVSEIWETTIRWFFRRDFLFGIFGISLFFLLPKFIKKPFLILLSIFLTLLSREIFLNEMWSSDKIFFLLLLFAIFINFSKLNFSTILILVTSQIIYMPFNYTSSRYIILFFILSSFVISSLFEKFKFLIFLIPFWSIFSFYKMNQGFSWSSPKSFNSEIGPTVSSVLEDKNFSSSDYIVLSSIPESFYLNSNYSVFSVKKYRTTNFQKRYKDFEDLKNKKFLLIFDISTKNAVVPKKNKIEKIISSKTPVEEVFLNKIYFLKNKSFASEESIKIYEVSFDEFLEIIV